MKKLLSLCVFLGLAFVFGQTESTQEEAEPDILQAEPQDVSPIAAVQFSGSGITDLETQTLFNRFLEELTKASDDPLIDQANINEKIAGLEIESTGCLSDECLKAGLDALSVQQLLAGTINFTKNESPISSIMGLDSPKYRVKVRKLDAAKSKPKKYSFRYKGEPDGFITELEILAWKIMGKEPPERLTGKRKPSQESMVEKIVEHPMFDKAIVLAVAGFAGSSYVKNTGGAKTSRDAANSMKDYKPGYDAHMESADSAQMKANLSLVAAIGALAYGYFTGVFSDDD
tara:strand:+ start:962 stop:1822 length:861 start_codon:yes stop_codon:yes gene_type:complete